MKTILCSVLLLLAGLTNASAQQRRLLATRGFTAADGYYKPYDGMNDSNATESTWLNPDSSTTVELRSVPGGALLRRDEYRHGTPVGTWMQQYAPNKPALKTVYDIEPEGTLASCATGYLYELGSESLSIGALAGNFTPPVMEGGKTVSQFLNGMLQYPASAREANIQGVVRIKGTLTTQGELTNLAISKSVDRDLDAEVYRVVKLMRFKGPALVDGRPAQLCVSLPVTFAMD